MRAAAVASIQRWFLDEQGGHCLISLLKQTLPLLAYPAALGRVHGSETMI